MPFNGNHFIAGATSRTGPRLSDTTMDCVGYRGVDSSLGILLKLSTLLLSCLAIIYARRALKTVRTIRDNAMSG